MNFHEVAFSIGEQLDNPSAPRPGPTQGTLASQREHVCNCKGPSSLISLDQACHDATRLAFRHRSKVTFSEVLAVPVVTSNVAWPPASKATKHMQATVDWACVQAALDAWAPSDMTLRPLRHCLDAMDFSHWGLRDTQHLLEHSLPTGPTFHHKLTLAAESSQDLDVRLCFLLMVASSPAGWPSRFVRKTQRDRRLQAILRSTLSPSRNSVAMQVDVPQRAPEAFPRGINSWLDAIGATPEIRKLDIELDQEDGDRWWLRIGSPQAADQSLRIPLRAHLLGAQGLRGILTTATRSSQKDLQ